MYKWMSIQTVSLARSSSSFLASSTSSSGPFNRTLSLLDVVPEKWHVITDTLIVFITYLLTLHTPNFVPGGSLLQWGVQRVLLCSYHLCHCKFYYCAASAGLPWLTDAVLCLHTAPHTQTCLDIFCGGCQSTYAPLVLTSSSCMRVIYHNWSATKQRPHVQSVASVCKLPFPSAGTTVSLF